MGVHGPLFSAPGALQNRSPCAASGLGARGLGRLAAGRKPLSPSITAGGVPSRELSATASPASRTRPACTGSRRCGAPGRTPAEAARRGSPGVELGQRLQPFVARSSLRAAGRASRCAAAASRVGLHAAAAAAAAAARAARPRARMGRDVRFQPRAQTAGGDVEALARPGPAGPARRGRPGRPSDASAPILHDPRRRSGASARSGRRPGP